MDPVCLRPGLEGFICPECKANFESAEILLDHYKTHEIKDVEETVTRRRWLSRLSLKFIFDISEDRYSYGAGKDDEKRRATISEAELRSKSLVYLFTGKTEKEKVKLTSRSHTDYWYKTRMEKIQTDGKQTDRILRNLEKYLSCNTKKSLWKRAKSILQEEAEEKVCSNCEKTFHLTTRRKRHCKLCYVAICDNCSFYLDRDITMALLCKTEEQSTPTAKLTQKPLRHCEDCNQLFILIEDRNKPDDVNNLFFTTYSEMQNLKRQLMQKVLNYKEVLDYLSRGKASEMAEMKASSLRADIINCGKEILSLGKHIATCSAPDGTNHAQIQLNILKAAKDFSEELMTLPKVPSPEAMEETRLRRPSNLSDKLQFNSGLQWDELLFTDTNRINE